MNNDYTEPALTVVVLDFQKAAEARACLESIRDHVKVPHRTIYYHNGPTDYAISLYHDGLVDLFMQSAKNNGLGVGTRDLMAVAFGTHCLYVQNDQVLVRDFTQPEMDGLIALLGTEDSQTGEIIASVSLAGAIGGRGVFSERAHFIDTSFYRKLERGLPLSPGGAGPYHHQPWREGQIQQAYRDHGLTHFTDWPSLVQDRGVWTRRTVAGGQVLMRTDTKAVYWEMPPTVPYVFPEHTPEEWALAIAGNWPPGKTPQLYIDRGQCFNCWGDANP